jgi:hypothetical protein
MSKITHANLAEAAQKLKQEQGFEQYAQQFMKPQMPDTSGASGYVPEGATPQGMTQQPSMMSPEFIQGAIPFLTPPQAVTALLSQEGKESPQARLMRELMVAQIRAGASGNKPTNMPPWYDAMAVEKMGSAYDTPEGKKRFSDYIMSPQGIKESAAYRTKYATETAPPINVFTQTAEGIVPGNVRTGKVGESTGLGKPLPAGEAAKIGDLNTLLVDIGEVKKLYKYGTNKEEIGWVGPVAGLVGKVREKYTGGASEDQVKFYSYVRDMKDALLRARSGAQINEQEYKRLVNFLPDENLPPLSFSARLNRFEEQLNIVLSQKKSALREGGYGKNLKSDNETITGISKEPRVPANMKNNDPLGIR